MSAKEKMPFSWKHFLLPGFITIIFNSLAVYLNLGVSGGDLFAGLLILFFQLMLTIGVGTYTFNWSIRQKRDLLLGLLFSYGIVGLFLEFMSY
jgi:hypothetical protein